MKEFIISTFILCGLTGIIRAEELQQHGNLVPADAPGWPQWRGKRRDGISDEKNLLRSWPVKGLKLLWTAGDIGNGYSTPIISEGTIFITGDTGNDLSIFAFSLDGKLKWKSKNGKAWKKSFPGSRSTCSYDHGRIYHMNAHGRVVCLDAKTGEESWAVNVLEKFEAKNITWGISESPLVTNRCVIVTPAGKKALMVGLDKKNGKTIWAASSLDTETSYASSILLDINGHKQVVNSCPQHVFAIDPENGKLIWSHRHILRGEMLSTTPLFYNNSLFITNSGRTEGFLYCLRLDPKSGMPEEKWSLKFKDLHGSMVCANGKIIGTSSMGKTKGWVSIDADTGKFVKLKNKLALGSAIYADGRIYCLSERGELALLKPAPNGFETVSISTFVKGKKVWAHPVICNGRLYLRYLKKLYCYDIRS